MEVFNHMNNASSQIDSKKRFSDRVQDYVQYRPSYPKEIILFLEKTIKLTTDSIIADIGSGTGILTKLFLDHGNKVFGIEPNPDMRSAGESFLKNYQNFTSIVGSSEKTSLPDNSVDIITAGQAYHWFDKELAKIEFKRILKESIDDNIVLIWNTRDNNTDFNKDLEDFITSYSTDYKKVSQTEDKDKNRNHFFGIEFKKQIFKNQQILDYQGLKGRLLSASYMIKKTDNKFLSFQKDLKEIFENYQVNNKVIIDYETEVFFGSI